jgi:hypothetical protein
MEEVTMDRVNVELPVAPDYCDDIDGEWSGPRTDAARDEVRRRVTDHLRRLGLTCSEDEVQVRDDGTWLVPRLEA